MKRIESKDNPLIRRLTRLSADRRFRREAGEMLCEGEKMLEEALDSGTAVFAVLLEEGRDMDAELLDRAEMAGAQLCQVPRALLAKVSNVETPQGVVFSCTRPLTELDALKNAERLLVLDALQDPGNLGTILRTADAFALDGIILGEGCVDVTSPKVVRATMGAVFRIPVVSATIPEAAEFVHRLGLPFYATALAADSCPLTQVALSRSAVVIGNEARGVSKQTLSLCDGTIIIPMPGRAESLNASVAASIVLYEMTRGKDEVR